MLTVQTMLVYSTSRSGSSLNNASPFITGYASFVDPIPLDLNLVPSNSGPSHTESDAAEDLSIRSTTQSVFPSQMDWCGPSGPSTSYIPPVQSDPMIPISRNPHSDILRFYQDFRLPNYTLDTLDMPNLCTEYLVRGLLITSCVTVTSQTPPFQKIWHH